jgi:hypothetical protein
MLTRYTWRQDNLEKARDIENAYSRRMHQLEDSARPDSRTKLYSIYQGIKYRCLNPKSKDYPNYGGRGIQLSPAFAEFSLFKEWALTHGYSEGLTIDRIDNDGDYSPENCRWITRAENIGKSNKTRIKRLIKNE